MGENFCNFLKNDFSVILCFVMIDIVLSMSLTLLVKRVVLFRVYFFQDTLSVQRRRYGDRDEYSKFLAIDRGVLLSDCN